LAEFGEEIKKNAAPPSEGNRPGEPGEMDVLNLSGVPDGESDGGAFDIGELIAEGVEEVNVLREKARHGDAYSSGEIEIDELTATAVTEFYVEVLLPETISQIGDLVVGGSFRYRKLSGRFEKIYKSTTKTLLMEGKVKLPTPAQCFVALTIYIIISNAVAMISERKKAKRKAEKLGFNPATIDESKPLAAQEAAQRSGPIPSSVSVELAKRGSFETEDGYYKKDLSGTYIKKGDRVYGPSECAKKALEKYTKSQDVKSEMKRLLQEDGK
jgi:hypothetical protein